MEPQIQFQFGLATAASPRYNAAMEDDRQQSADRTAPLSDTALERIQALAKPYFMPGPSIVDEIIAERLAEAARDNEDSSVDSEPSNHSTRRASAPQQLRRAVLKPDLVAQHKREWTQACVNSLRRDLLEFGIEVSDDAIFGAWERYSDSNSAGWLALYGDAETNVRALVKHLDIDH